LGVERAPELESPRLSGDEGATVSRAAGYADLFEEIQIHLDCGHFCATVRARGLHGVASSDFSGSFRGSGNLLPRGCLGPAEPDQPAASNTQHWELRREETSPSWRNKMRRSSSACEAEVARLLEMHSAATTPRLGASSEADSHSRDEAWEASVPGAEGDPWEHCEDIVEQDLLEWFRDFERGSSRSGAA